jgi:hypothetical protein
MVLPHQLGLSTTSKGNAAKPDASCAQQELNNEQGDGDQAKGLRKEKDFVSMLHKGGKIHVQHARL